MMDRWEADFTDGLNSWIFAWGADFRIGMDLEVSLSAKSGYSKRLLETWAGKKWEKFSTLAHKPDDRTKENMNQHACPKIIIWQHKVFNQFCIHHRLKSGMLKDICAGAKYISNLRQEFTGMLRDTFHLLLEWGTEGIIY